MDDLNNGNKRAIISNSNDSDVEKGGAKRRKVCHEGETDVTVGNERKKTIQAKTDEWKRSHPICFSERFVFFYSTFAALCYNAENGFLAQAKLKRFRYIDGLIYKSAYHLYSSEKAEIVKQFNLQRRNTIDGNFKAGDLPRMIREDDGGVLEISDMKALFMEFEWTDEAEQAWESKVREVLCTANFYKFTQNVELYRKLQGTGDRYLIKSCPTTCECTCGIRHEFLIAMECRERWGRNLLGKTLMRLREDLKSVVVPMKQHPTREQLAAVWSIDYIDDGRSHQCEKCHKKSQP